MSSHPLLHLLSFIASPGFDRELVALVLRNTPGAKVDPDDIRTVQAANAWWRNFGGDVSFEAYLESIPAAPDFVALRREFPTLDLPLLVDPRLGHVRAAELVGFRRGEDGRDDSVFQPVDDRHIMPTSEPYWVLAHDGTPNRNRRPQDCLADCNDRFLAGIVDVLVAIWLQCGPRRHGMDGPGSVTVVANGSTCCACVRPSVPCLMPASTLALRNYGAVAFVKA